MLNKIMCITLLLVLSGCANRVNYISFCNEAGGDIEQQMRADSNSLETTSEQAADGQLDASLTGL